MRSFVICCLLTMTFSSTAFSQTTKPMKEPDVSSWAEGRLRLSILSSSLNPFGGHSHVAEELEVIDSQKKEIQILMREYFIESRSAVSRFNNAAMETRTSAKEKTKFDSEKTLYDQTMAKLVSDTEQSLETVMMPHQLSRLKQVAYQLNVCYKNKVSGAFVLMPLVEELEGITDKQKKAFLKTTQRLMEEFEEEVKELRKEKEKEIWGAMTDDIRNRIRDKVGDIIYEKAR